MAGAMDARRIGFRVCAAAALGLWALPGPPAQAAPAPANSLRELSTALNRCLGAANGLAGSELTIIFSLRRDGALLGVPRITFARLPGDAADQRKFTESVGAAFAKCLPVAITDGLGGAIAGRPLTIRFVIRPPETGA